MNTPLKTTLVALAVLASYPAAADGMEPVPVMVGGEADMDACGSIGLVSGLDPDGSNRLRVRSGPGTEHPQIASVKTGQVLFVCLEAGDWRGVVYGTDDAECGVSSPISQARAYEGPCQSGWVHGDYVSPLAG